MSGGWVVRVITTETPRYYKRGLDNVTSCSFGGSCSNVTRRETSNVFKQPGDTLIVSFLFITKLTYCLWVTCLVIRH